MFFHTDTIFGRMPHHVNLQSGIDSLHNLYSEAMWYSGCTATFCLFTAILILAVYIFFMHRNHEKNR